MPATRPELRRLVRNKLMAWPDAVTTLSAGVNASVTTIAAANADGITERALVEIGSEIMRVQAVSGNNLNVLRGDRGTTAAAHGSGAAVRVYPFWGWPDLELNDFITDGIRFLGDEVWYGKPYENTAIANAKEVGLPPGVQYPDGDRVFRVEAKNGSGKFIPIYRWRHEHDRLIFDTPFSHDRGLRIWTVARHRPLTNDVAQIEDDNITDAVVQYAIKQALEALLSNRTRYTEYSASLNDRASTPDELQRQCMYFFNQAVLAKERISRAGPSGFANIRRQG